ncbi:hypothetical protein ACFS5N_16440 [Mucilaginibacter ximonensis]|uniref:DnaA-like protein n=1 Tax=Mucilaginibacter ximonensis TaxID=538021 RepID=A0ABW5YFK5_9SPHI
MNPQEIIRITEQEMGMRLSEIAGTYEVRLSKYHPGLRLRCMIALVLDQEGYGAAFIARMISVSPNRVYTLIQNADAILSTWPWMDGYDRYFKRSYLSIMGRITQLEDAA